MGDRGDGELKPGIGGVVADAGNQIELSLDFVAKQFGFGVAEGVGEKLVRIFAAVGEAEGNVGQVSHEGSGERVLAVDGEDDAGVVLARFEFRQHPVFRLAVLPRGGGFEPGGIVNPHVVHHRQLRSQRRPRRRGHEGDMAMGTAGLDGRQRRGRHQHIPQAIEADAENPLGSVPIHHGSR